MKPPNDLKEQRKSGSWDPIDEASAESFPASDPPAHHVEKKPPKVAAELPTMPPAATPIPPPPEPK